MSGTGLANDKPNCKEHSSSLGLWRMTGLCLWMAPLSLLHREFCLYGLEVYAYIMLLLVAHVADPGVVGTIGRELLLSFDR